MPAGQPPRLCLFTLSVHLRGKWRQNSKLQNIRNSQVLREKRTKHTNWCSREGHEISFICQGGAQGVRFPFLLFVFSCSQMEQPVLQSARHPHLHTLPHTGGSIAYREICLLSRVWFSRSTLACKITSVNSLRTTKTSPIPRSRNKENSQHPFIHLL